MYKYILFDLDGTLTESGEGITRSVQYALEKIGKPENNLEKLKVFIGPPLIEQFMDYSSIDIDEARSAVKFFRDRFSTKGIFENKLYPNVVETLKKLNDLGYILSVASSKPEFFVRQILENFNIDGYFKEAVGSTMDEKRTEKSQVIDEVLNRLNINDKKENILMVGDRKHDILGAKYHNIDCVAVSYGYGSMEEIQKENPILIINSIDEILNFLI